MRRTKEQIIADSLEEGYVLLEEGHGNYEIPVKKFRSEGYDVRYWYMDRNPNESQRSYEIYGLLKSMRKLVPMPGIEKLAELKQRVFDIDPGNMNCFNKMLGINSLASLTGVEKVNQFNTRQKKAQKNIKYCANDQWQFVNSWYDQKDEDARDYMLDAEELFNNIYDDSLKNVYSEGSCHFGAGCESYLNDIKFCGKKFLETLTLFYTSKLLEDAFYEVEGTMEDAQHIMNQLTKIKERVGC